MRCQSADFAAALGWIWEPVNNATRGRRAVAFAIAFRGPSAIDGVTTIRAAAAARGVPESTLWADLATLRSRFGIVAPVGEAPAIATARHPLETDAPEDSLDDRHLPVFEEETW